ASVARSGRCPVRLLPIRSDHGRRGAPRQHTQTERRRHRRRHVGQCVSVRDLSANSRCDSPRLRLPMSERSYVLGLDRRSFLKAGAAIGGGLAIDFAFPLLVRPALAQTSASPAFAPNAFIRIDRQSVVTLVMPMVEMGQGIYTATAM